MKFLLKVFGGRDALNATGAVVLEISLAQRDQLLRRRAGFLAVRAYEKEAYCTSFWDGSADWFETSNEDVCAALEKDDVIDDPRIVNLVTAERVRTECEQVVVNETGVYWTAIVKHTSIEIETAELAWEALVPTPA